jgi:hypothetical protein
MVVRLLLLGLVMLPSLSLLLLAMPLVSPFHPRFHRSLLPHCRHPNPRPTNSLHWHHRRLASSLVSSALVA